MTLYSLVFFAILSALIHELETQTDKYRVVPQLLGRPAAQTYCKTEYGTDLASIHSEDDNNAVKELCRAAGNVDCWIGLNDIAQEGTFEWEDGTVFDYGSDVSGGVGPWSTISSAGPQPNNAGNEDCVELKYPFDHDWNDASCTASSEVQYFICNAYSTESTQTPTADTQNPTNHPSSDPTLSPTTNTQSPTKIPSYSPTPLPTNMPSVSPSDVPSLHPSRLPTDPTLSETSDIETSLSSMTAFPTRALSDGMYTPLSSENTTAPPPPRTQLVQSDALAPLRLAIIASCGVLLCGVVCGIVYCCGKKRKRTEMHLKAANEHAQENNAHVTNMQKDEKQCDEKCDSNDDLDQANMGRQPIAIQAATNEPGGHQANMHQDDDQANRSQAGAASFSRAEGDVAGAITAIGMNDHDGNLARVSLLDMSNEPITAEGDDDDNDDDEPILILEQPQTAFIA